MGAPTTFPKDAVEHEESAMGDRFPFPIPTGWWAVCRSEELPVNAVQTVEAFDAEWVMWRGDQGVIMAEAYCPHMGAHLGDGKIENGVLTCPFHGWQFDVGGKPVRGADNLILKTKGCLQKLQVVEKQGYIFAWFSTNPATHAYYSLDDLPPLPSETEWDGPHHQDFIIDSCWQELRENVVDWGHFTGTHGHPISPEDQVDEYNGLYHHAEAPQWYPTPKGVVTGRIIVDAFATAWGTARMVGWTDIFEYAFVTPITPEKLAYRTDIYVKAGNQNLIDATIRNLRDQMNHEIVIWERKRYVEEPLLTQHDGPIMDMRAWCAQFYK